MGMLDNLLGLGVQGNEDYIGQIAAMLRGRDQSDLQPVAQTAFGGGVLPQGAQMMRVQDFNAMPMSALPRQRNAPGVIWSRSQTQDGTSGGVAGGGAGSGDWNDSGFYDMKGAGNVTNTMMSALSHVSPIDFLQGILAIERHQGATAIPDALWPDYGRVAPMEMLRSLKRIESSGGGLRDAMLPIYARYAPLDFLHYSKGSLRDMQGP